MSAEIQFAARYGSQGFQFRLALFVNFSAPQVTIEHVRAVARSPRREVTAFILDLNFEFTDGSNRLRVQIVDSLGAEI